MTHPRRTLDATILPLLIFRGGKALFHLIYFLNRLNIYFILLNNFDFNLVFHVVSRGERRGEKPPRRVFPGPSLPHRQQELSPRQDNSRCQGTIRRIARARTFGRS